MEVQLIDVFGSDKRVVDAARVSFAKEASNYTDEQNAKLIKYLSDHNHWSPFAHVVITIREKVPIFVARQRFKHRIGFEYNEVSRRYVDDEPEFFIPVGWRKRADNLKQGSSDEVITSLDWYYDHKIKPSHNGPSIKGAYKEFLEQVERFYNVMINSGVAPEQARMVLPQSMYTEFYSTGSLAAWARMINLRKDSHAQKEIQDLARMCDEVIRGLSELKHSWEALVGDKWY